MITLKLNMYSDKELKLLVKLLADMEGSISNALCRTNVTCCSCEYRHICYDVERSRNFVKKVIKERVNEK